MCTPRPLSLNENPDAVALTAYLIVPIVGADGSRMGGTAEATTGYWITENGEKACIHSLLRTVTRYFYPNSICSGKYWIGSVGATH